MYKAVLFPALAALMIAASPLAAGAGQQLPEGKYVTKAALNQLFPGTFLAKFKKYKVRFTASRNGMITGKYRLFSDKGNWWVRDRKLCIRLKNWFKGKTRCSHVIQYGPVYVAKDVVFRKL